jgi:hypothetical protein
VRRGRHQADVLQHGYTGILNISFIVCQFAGAYSAAVLTLGPYTVGSFSAGRFVPYGTTSRAPWRWTRT